MAWNIGSAQNDGWDIGSAQRDVDAGGGIAMPLVMLEHDHFNGGEIEELGENG